MSTQNDSVKAATRESAKRWGTDPKARLACVIAEQKAYLAELCGIKEIQLTEHEEAEEISDILCAMSKNVWYEGVLDWMREKPLLSFHVVQPWLQAKGKRTARAVLTGTGYSVCRVTRHGNSSLT